MNRTFRRRVLSLSLATTLAFGAFGVPALAAPPSDQVNDHFTRDVNKLYKDIFGGHETELREFRDNLRSFILNVDQETVKSWFGPRYDRVMETIGSPHAFALDVVELLLPGETSIGDLKKFRDKYEPIFEEIFEDKNVTPDDFLLFFIDLQKEALNPSLWKKLSPDDLNRDIVIAIVREAAKEVLSKNKHAELNELFRERVGISLNEIVDIGRQVLSQFNVDYRDSYRAIRTILYNYALKEIIKQPGDRDRGRGGGGGGGGGSSKPAEPTLRPIIPTSKNIVAPKVEKTVENKVTVVTIDAEDFEKKLDDNRSAKAIILSVKGNTGAGQAVLNIEDIEKAADNNENNDFIIQTDGAEYVLPVSLINRSTLADALDVDESDLDDASLLVALKDRSDDAYDGDGELKAKIVDFSLAVKIGSREHAYDHFGRTYVERAFEINDNFRAAKSVGVVFDDNGSVAPIPTQFVRSNGKDVAVLKRTTNTPYTVVENDIALRDIRSHWARADIQLLADKLIVSGYEDGTFKPQNNVTRAEFATLIVRALGLPANDRNAGFRDISSDHWHAGTVKAAVDAGLVAGYEDGTFRPNQPITRQEASTIIANTLDFLALRGNVTSEQALAALDRFNDQQAIAAYARESVGVATSLGLIRGDDKGSFNPVNHTTRAETVAMLTRLLEKANFISK